MFPLCYMYHYACSMHHYACSIKDTCLRGDFLEMLKRPPQNLDLELYKLVLSHWNYLIFNFSFLCNMRCTIMRHVSRDLHFYNDVLKTYLLYFPERAPLRRSSPRSSSGGCRRASDVVLILKVCFLE